MSLETDPYDFLLGGYTLLFGLARVDLAFAPLSGQAVEGRWVFDDVLRTLLVGLAQRVQREGQPILNHFGLRPLEELQEPLLCFWSDCFHLHSPQINLIKI